MEIVIPRPAAEGSVRQGRGSLVALRTARLTIAVGLIIASSDVLAANGIDVRRGEDSLVFGSCVPSLVVENRSSETVDYLQVDVIVTLGDGRRRTVELMSAYREGVLYPIAPGGTATLKQHLDTSLALGVGCGELKDRSVVLTICEASGKPCDSVVSVQP